MTKHQSTFEPFAYLDGVLHCEQVATPEVADRFGTPAFVYSADALAGNYHRLARAFEPLHPKVCFSIKSCHNLHILDLLREQGAAFDAVSIGEIRRALAAGANAADVVFAGAGKTRAEIAEALQLGVGGFNVESAAELEVLADEAQAGNTRARAALRINPDVDAKTHPYTTTGKSENKFGIDITVAVDLFAKYRDHAHVQLDGMHVHIGSPVKTTAPYVEAIEKTLQVISDLRDRGVSIQLLNLGGGYGVCYEDDDAPPVEEYAAAIVPLLRDQSLEIHLEPGRSITANAGMLLTRTTYIKQGCVRRFVIVDAAMTDLIRPALYDAYHFVWPACPGERYVPPGKARDLTMPGCEIVDVVGPVCESSDFLAKQRSLPPIKAGDLLAVFSAGAYGAVMGSQYNSRPRPPEVLIRGAEMKLIRRRETFDDLVATERDV
jgi:diaminopimelate decarboxylase